MTGQGFDTAAEETMARMHLATKIADAINQTLGDNAEIGARVVNGNIEIVSSVQNQTFTLNASAINGTGNSDTSQSIAIVNQDSGNNDNNGAPVNDTADHTLSFNYSGIVAPITIRINGSNDTPQITGIDTTGEIREDEFNEWVSNTIVLNGVYEAGDQVEATINGQTITYTVTADDLSLNGDGTGGNASPEVALDNIAIKLAAEINDFNLHTGFGLGTISAESIGNSIEILKGHPEEVVNTSSIAINGTNNFDDSQSAITVSETDVDYNPFRKISAIKADRSRGALASFSTNTTTQATGTLPNSKVHLMAKSIGIGMTY